MTTVSDALATHPFFSGLSTDHLELIAGCAEEVAIATGTHVLTADAPADRLYAILSGRVAIEIGPPHKDPLVIETVGAGDLLGISWMMPPYRWSFDARASDATTAVAVDAARLRALCEDDPTLGRELYSRVAAVMRRRLQATRLRLLDLYGPRG